MLTLVKLEGLGAAQAHQLSGGQRQRVALARSLAKRPKVLLLDEPLAALDKKLREETQFELMDMQERLGITFVIVTHDQEEAMTVADRIAVMDSGELVQVATPSEIYEQPNSRCVADFIGDINLIEGGVVEAQRHWRGDRGRRRTALARRRARTAQRSAARSPSRCGRKSCASRRGAGADDAQCRARPGVRTSAISATCRSTRSGSTTAAR